METEYRYVFTKYFNEHEVKVYGERANVVFECDDICSILGLSTDVVEREKSHEKIFVKAHIVTAEDKSEIKYMLTEDGVYKFIFASSSHEDERFAVWIKNVIKEVLLQFDKGSKKNEENDKTENEKRFDVWLHENIVFKENNVLQLSDVCKQFTDKPLYNYEKMKYKKQIDRFIKQNFTNLRCVYGIIKINDETFKGWENLCVKTN